MIGSQELILIFLAIILLFGASKLPELARSFGTATGEFKKAQMQTERELEELKFQNNLSDTNSIHKLAKELNIDIVGKDDAKIMEEIKKAIKLKSSENIEIKNQ